jgi:predicted nucleotidyltransferase
MNQHVEWRLRLARELALRIHQFPGVAAIVVGGSVARGWADEYSDLELPVFWESLPDDATRLALAQSLEADFLYEYNGPSGEDQLLLRGFQFDLWHNTIALEETVIKAVLEEFSTDLGDSNFMDTVRTCIPLYGEEIIRNWQKRVQEYPPGLAMRVISEQLPNFSAAQLRLAGQRDNPIDFYDHLCRLQQEVFLVLLALNRQYFPAYKWMYRRLATMELKPANVSIRMQRMFTLPYSQATDNMQNLLVETLDLVDQQLPQIDTKAARLKLIYQRRPQISLPENSKGSLFSG